MRVTHLINNINKLISFLNKYCVEAAFHVKGPIFHSQLISVWSYNIATIGKLDNT